MNIKRLIEQAFEEDLGRGDLFSKIIEKDEIIKVKITAKDNGVFAGEVFLKEIAHMQKLVLKLFVKDGDEFKKGDKIATIEGAKSIILLSERVMLNFIQHASGIASLTSLYKKAIGDAKINFLDTRKTRPGLRELEKYAVVCGGGQNHRMGLDDMLMMKDTHLRGVKDLGEFLANARKKMPIGTKIEIECDSFEEVQNAAKAGVDIALLDNMSVDECKKIVAWRDENYPFLKLEASGNITLDTIGEYARSGVDSVSSGATIHQARWVDFSMRLDD